MAPHRDWFDWTLLCAAVVGAVGGTVGALLMIAALRRNRTSAVAGQCVCDAANGKIQITGQISTASNGGTVKQLRFMVFDGANQLPVEVPNLPSIFFGIGHHPFQRTVRDDGQTELRIVLDMKFSDRGKLRFDQTVPVRENGEPRATP